MVPELTSRRHIKLNSITSLPRSPRWIGLAYRTLPPSGFTMAKPPRQHVRRGGFVIRREAVVRKLVSLVFGVFVWAVLLAAVVTTVARLSTEAKERRAQSAEHIAKSKY